MARSTSAAILACALGAPALAQSRQHLPEPLDLRISASVAAKEGRVLLVLFSETGCMFCEHLRREVLLPMQRNADLRKKIEFFQVDVDAPKSLRDFAGIESTQKELARRYRIRIMPTVLLLGPQGEILAEPLVGFNGSDFYGAYLDERIETARGKLSTRRAVPK
ncbi:MAG: thioredoxin family protein [Burkholderiales bacterium]